MTRANLLTPPCMLNGWVSEQHGSAIISFPGIIQARDRHFAGL